MPGTILKVAVIIIIPILQMRKLRLEITTSKCREGLYTESRLPSSETKTGFDSGFLHCLAGDFRHIKCLQPQFPHLQNETVITPPDRSVVRDKLILEIILLKQVNDAGMLHPAPIYHVPYKHGGNFCN